jgi:hypothetical protein
MALQVDMFDQTSFQDTYDLAIQTQLNHDMDFCDSNIPTNDSSLTNQCTKMDTRV